MQYSTCTGYNSSYFEPRTIQSGKSVGMISYTTFLLVIGIPGNVISGFFMGTDNSNRLTTRILMVSLAIGDTSVLLTAIFIRYWIRSITNWDIRMYSTAACKLHGSVSGFCTDFAFFALCGIAVERFIVVAFPQRSHYIITVKNVVTSVSMITLLLIVKNFAMIYFTIYDPVRKSCKQDLLSWKIGDFLSFAVIPSCILFFCNAVIFIILKKRRQALRRSMNNSVDTKSDQLKKSMLEAIKKQNNARKPGDKSKNHVEYGKKRKPENVIKVLLGLTLIHAICTLPGTVLQVLLDYVKMSVDACRTCRNIQPALIMLVFSNNAINFFVYLVTCIGFRHRVSNLFKPMSNMCSFICGKNDSFTSGMSRYSSVEMERNVENNLRYKAHSEPVKLILSSPYDQSDNSRSGEENVPHDTNSKSNIDVQRISENNQADEMLPFSC